MVPIIGVTTPDKALHNCKGYCKGHQTSNEGYYNQLLCSFGQLGGFGEICGLEAFHVLLLGAVGVIDCSYSCWKQTEDGQDGEYEKELYVLALYNLLLLAGGLGILSEDNTGAVSTFHHHLPLCDSGSILGGVVHWDNTLCLCRKGTFLCNCIALWDASFGCVLSGAFFVFFGTNTSSSIALYSAILFFILLKNNDN